MEIEPESQRKAMQVPPLQRRTYMKKKQPHSNKDFGYSVGNDAIFTKHLTDLNDQINILQKALANSHGDNLLKIATVSNELDRILQNFNDPVKSSMQTIRS